MPEIPIAPGSMVRAVMDAHPETVPIFLRRRMSCPGCVMSSFMTLAEAAASHEVDVDDLVADLAAAISLAQSGDRT